MNDFDAKIDERLRILKEARKDQEETLRLIRESFPAMEEARKSIDESFREKEQQIATLTVSEDRKLELELQVLQGAAITGVLQVLMSMAYMHRVSNS